MVFSKEEINHIIYIILYNINDDNIIYVDKKDIYHFNINNVLTIIIENFTLNNYLYTKKIHDVLNSIKLNGYIVTVVKSENKLRLNIKKIKETNKNVDTFKIGDMVEIINFGSLEKILKPNILNMLKNKKYFIIDDIDGEYIKIKELEELLHMGRFKLIDEDKMKEILNVENIDKYKGNINSDIKIIFKLYNNTKSNKLKWKIQNTHNDGIKKYVTYIDITKNKKIYFLLYHNKQLTNSSNGYLVINLYVNNVFKKEIKTINNHKHFKMLLKTIEENI